MVKRRTPFAPLQFVIITRDTQGQQTGSLGSTHDLEATKRLAVGLLRLAPVSSHADIYHYSGEERQDAYQSEPVERVEQEAAQ
ncbi:MAG: hypothetical protein H0U76_25780 [Ktedonobacteraceae bacterium]|nr:hypothetical protein [Ktedonobacteraceae bacterium]